MKLKPGKQNDMNTYCPHKNLKHFAGQGFHLLKLISKCQYSRSNNIHVCNLNHSNPLFQRETTSNYFFPDVLSTEILKQFQKLIFTKL